MDINNFLPSLGVSEARSGGIYAPNGVAGIPVTPGSQTKSLPASGSSSSETRTRAEVTNNWLINSPPKAHEVTLLTGKSI